MIFGFFAPKWVYLLWYCISGTCSVIHVTYDRAGCEKELNKVTFPADAKPKFADGKFEPNQAFCQGRRVK